MSGEIDDGSHEFLSNPRPADLPLCPSGSDLTPHNGGAPPELSRWRWTNVRSPSTPPGDWARLATGMDSLKHRDMEEPIITPVPPPKVHPYDQWAPDARALDLVGDKWTLLIVRDLIAGPRRFVELQRVLPGISTEQLRSRLNRMVADGLLTRQRYREVPPRVDYELTERARDLEPVVASLARWGYRWTWGAPHEGEEIDIGAILRLAPGLLTGTGRLRGTVECLVTGRSKGAPERTYSFTGSRDIATLREEPLPDPDARVSGDERAWITALGPENSRAGLDISGKTPLADAVLDVLAEASASGISVAA
jgi:DNA-binding HxlR family transcriptional regulator